jgi:type II secretory pathway pseudopilin PulG
MKRQELTARWKQYRSRAEQGLFLVMGVIILCAGALPFWQEGFAKRQQAKALQEHQEEIRRFAARYDGEKEQTLQKQYEALCQAIPEALSGHAALPQLTLAAARTGVVLTAIKPGPVKKDSTGVKQTFELEVQDDYFGLLCFLRELNESAGPWIVESGGVTRQGDGNQLNFRAKIVEYAESEEVVSE